MTKESLPPESASPPSDNADAVHAPAAVATLKRAMRRARLDSAERAGVLSDQRAARLGRLEILQDELQPLVAQIPPDVDMFDVAILPSANPRLFIDMIGFVEMGRDPRLYRLVQDTRHNRILMAESEDLDTMVDAVTDYVARRLLERDKALAADMTRGGARRTRPDKRALPRIAENLDANARPVVRSEPDAVVKPHDTPPPARRQTRWVATAFAFLINLLGSIAFFTILAALGWYGWNWMHPLA